MKEQREWHRSGLIVRVVLSEIWPDRYFGFARISFRLPCSSINRTHVFTKPTGHTFHQGKGFEFTKISIGPWNQI